MKKSLVKICLLGFALLAIALIPGNAKFVFGYGDSPTFAGSTTEAPVCNKEQSDKVVLYEPNHPLLPKATGPNEVRLNWLKVSNADKYTIAFGLSSGNYIYGFPDTGDTDHFTVGDLVPGNTYYFVVRGVNGCMPGPWSMEWGVKIGGGTGFSTTLDTNSPLVTTPPNLFRLPAAGTSPEDLQPTPTPPTYTPPPFPTPTPLGFFQGLWHNFLGIFGK